MKMPGHTSLMRRTVLALALVASAPLALAQSPIVIKFSHVVASDTPMGRAADFFAKRAAELTKGRVKVEVYPNSQLYKDKEEMEALQLGSVQMLAPSLSKFAPLGVKEFEVFDLPFIFDDYTDLHTITQGPVGAKLLKKLQSRGITGLAYWDNGFKVMSANKPLKSVEDYKGVKMRIQSSKVLDAQMRAVGAIPQVMAFSETYQALQTGVVDGAENNAPSFFTSNHYSTGAKFYTQTNHLIIPELLVVSKVTWDKLSKDDQALLKKFGREAQLEQRALWDKSVEDYTAKLKAAGVEFINIDNKPFFDATAPVRAKYGANYADLMKRIEAVK